MQVTPPSHRFDLTAPIDLVEEVARLVGYEKLPERPLQGPIRLLPTTASQTRAGQWALRLVCRGYQETIHMPFTDPLLDNDFSWSVAPAIGLRNPLAQDQSILRRSLWPSLVDTLRYNLAREQKRVRIFEIGTVFERTPGGPCSEKKVAAGLWHGLYREEEWGQNTRLVDFFDVKADVELLLEPIREGLHFESLHVPMLDPAESAIITLKGHHLGVLGAVHPGLQKRWEIRGKTYLWSLNVIDLEHFAKVEYKPVAKFPAVRRDLAFIVPETVPFHEIHQALLENGRPLLKEIKLFDLYAGPTLDAGFRSLAFSLLFRDQDSTLTEKAVNDLCAKLVDIVEGRFCGKLRK
ncbi:phenylalanyl-tRNA synthetase, beta subunit [mine drainage metagenome]|uniref:phenylalanine--tRNA ligase n=1 Tax=mine drainage metagenome TaxID=410659 RepID=T1BU92_9ZZZZ